MKKYEVISTFRVRQKMIVEAIDEKVAESIMDNAFKRIDWVDNCVDTLVSFHATEVKEEE